MQLSKSPSQSPSPPSTSLALTLHHAQPHEPPFLTPEPLQVYHPDKPTTIPVLLLGSPSSAGRCGFRRSPRLVAASSGVVTRKSGSGSGSGFGSSALLLQLPNGKEKKGCELVRACVGEIDLGVRFLRSRKLHLGSGGSGGGSGGGVLVSNARKRKKGGEDEGSVGSKMRRSELRSPIGMIMDASVRSVPRLTMADNVGSSVGEGRRVRCSPRSSMASNAVRNEQDKQLRCSLRSPMSNNVERIEQDKQLRRSPRSPMSNNVGRIEQDMQLRRSPRSPMSNNVGRIEQDKQLRRLPRSPMLDNVGNTKKQISSMGKKSMKTNVGMIDEEEDKVLRRSPRALPSSIMAEDDEIDHEIRLLERRKKRKEEKKRALSKVSNSSSTKKEEEEKKKKKWVSGKCFFVGEPVSEQEAHQKWGWRYQPKNTRIKSRSLTGNDEEADEVVLQVKCHYTQAEVNGRIFNLGDCALIRGEGKQKHIGRIKEFFRSIEDEDYFRVHWFYKPEDTVMKEETSFHNKKRIFYSAIENDNMLDCIISKLNITQVSPELYSIPSSLPPSDYYFDMEYCLDYSTFRNLQRDNCVQACELPSHSSPDSVLSPVVENTSICDRFDSKLNLLDLYAGCGAMSTGLCMGARLSGVNLVTRWAIDYDKMACESLRLNHSETKVRNEAAENFLELLKHWEKLCKQYIVEEVENQSPAAEEVPDLTESNSEAQIDSDIASEELEVSSLIDICYELDDGSGNQGLKFKVRWKGYCPEEDTWEPIDGLSNCQDLIQDFVIKGFKNKILPLPGDVDVICGGPPCQGISGYNRFRCVDDPLADERNRQLIVFMDIVEYLKPKFVLMENVMDIIKFDKGSLGRYALSRLVHSNYQARVGIMAAGCYGLPQFRLRVFFWGALPSEELPQFPLPTHDVVVRYWPPAEFERNVVAYEEGQPPELEDAVLLGDAIADLPEVTNYELLDEMPYSKPPQTKFQKFIRSTNCGMTSPKLKAEEPLLYDHRPHQLFEDDYTRVCMIPRKKGANFRDLPGIIVGDDNVVRRDPTVETELLPSGRPMVPEYAFTFEQGKSKRPFARLWWDETMPTIVTYPNCHSQAILHPEQDRVLTVRECARLQGFPDNYRFCGTVKQRYRQVGNAVAVPVAKALGYALGMAYQKLIDNQPLLTLPPNFAYSNCL